MILGSRKRTKVLFKSNIPVSRMFNPTSGISDRMQELQNPGLPTQTLLLGDFQDILADLGLVSFKFTCCKLLYCHNRCIFRFGEDFCHWTDMFGVYLAEPSLLRYENLFHLDFKISFLWEIVAQRLQLDVSRSWKGRCGFLRFFRSGLFVQSMWFFRRERTRGGGGGGAASEPCQRLSAPSPGRSLLGKIPFSQQKIHCL